MSEKQTVNEPRTKTVTLAHPMNYGGEEIKSVTFRAPKGGDLKRVANLPQGSINFALMPILSEYEEAVFDEMDGADVMACVGAITGFLLPAGK